MGCDGNAHKQIAATNLMCSGRKNPGQALPAGKEGEMRIISLVTAAMITVVASYYPAGAQATNTAPSPGTAKTLSGTGSDVKANQQNTGGALSQTCDSKAVSKTGKQLTGAAKTSF